MTSETFLDGKVTLYSGNCLDVLPTLEVNSIDACVTDPPYHLTSIVKRFGGNNSAPCKPGKTGAYARASAGFMGKQWDGGDIAFRPETWAAVYRVLKPGAHLVAFGGTRTFGRMQVAIEEAGFEIRDCVMWLYGSGFPKSHDVSKGIDRARDDSDAILRVTTFMADAASRCNIPRADVDDHMGTSDMGGWWLSRLKHRCQCPQWDQWLRLKAFLRLNDEMDSEVWRLNGRKGTPGEAWDQREIVGTSRGTLKVAGEREATPWSVGAEQSSIDLNVTAPATASAQQWSGFGTALKPACEPIVLARKPLSEGTVAANVLKWGTGALNIDGCRVHSDDAQGGEYTVTRLKPGATLNATGGNWRPEEGGVKYNGELKPGRWPANVLHDGSPEVVEGFPETNSGGGPEIGTARSKVNTYGDPTVSLSEPYGQNSGSAARFFYTAKADSDDRLGSKHPTVKPLDLMQWLVRLVTPPRGTVLDCFSGTGTTGEAAFREGMRAVLIEREEEYQNDIRRRMALALSGTDERAREGIKARQQGKPIDHGPLFAESVTVA